MNKPRASNENGEQTSKQEINCKQCSPSFGEKQINNANHQREKAEHAFGENADADTESPKKEIFVVFLESKNKRKQWETDKEGECHIEHRVSGIADENKRGWDRKSVV